MEKLLKRKSGRHCWRYTEGYRYNRYLYIPEGSYNIVIKMSLTQEEIQELKVQGAKVDSVNVTGLAERIGHRKYGYKGSLHYAQHRLIRNILWIEEEVEVWGTYKMKVWTIAFFPLHWTIKLERMFDAGKYNPDIWTTKAHITRG